ncbi:glycoside hydrolase family 95 protein [Paraflavisolibacter sp. H34]|uniref:glycoside hydrolase family 95 protein n=1 Tax=Huijunlia imazamoxiresistens TaxID=3127457 RepID=UPI00301852FC
MARKGYLFIPFLIACLTAGAQTPRNNDLKLWYRQPAVKWTEALPIGNGRLGAMVFGGVEQDRIQFNEETLWTGAPREYNREGAARYLGPIRELLFEGRQDSAEKLAEQKFMGLKSAEGGRAQWFRDMREGKGISGDPAQPGFDDRSWKTMRVPSYEGWEAIGYEGLDGALWFRTTFELPPSWQGKNLVLDLNRVRDQDFTYLNGKLAGTTDGLDPRRYILKKEDLRPGTNTLAVQVLNYFDKGGIAGYKDTSRAISVYPEGGDPKEGISLVKQWKYLVQNDEPPAVPRYQADYQPFGDIWLNMKGTAGATGYRRELDLSTATIRTTYTVGGVTYTREYFASQPNGVIAVRLSASKPGSLSFETVLNSPHQYAATRKVDNHTLALSVKVRNGALRGESYLRVQSVRGKITVGTDRIRVDGADEVVLYLAAGTNYKNYKDVTADPLAPVKTALQSLSGKTFAAVKAAHLREYGGYFNRFSLDLGRHANEALPTNERIEQFAGANDVPFAALFLQYGRYLLISSSRPGTRPANLQGIWNDLLSPPWGSKYTTNINAQMNYWPAEALNLSAMHEPLLQMIGELAEAGKKTARIHYNAPGWVLHHNTDLWRGTAPINAANHGIWVTGAAWLSQHLWEHYQFTGDKAFLQQRAYPLMKEAALFFHAFLVKDPKTGWLISTPSNSPEHGGLVAGPTMDHQIIRDLFSNVIKASEVLGTDAELRKNLKEKYGQIAPNRIGRHGQLQEWLQDVDDTTDTHRHVSHLWGVHPGREINWDQTPDLMKAARQSLIYRGDAGTGWSLAWKINWWARFKDGDHTYKMIQMLISPAAKGGGAYPNLFDAHPPFQIDGNFGGAAGIGEMLLQSQNGYLDLLPALPKAMPEGSVRGLCARGGFEVSLLWQHNALKNVTVLSKNGGPCVLKYAGKEQRFSTVKGKTYSFNGALKAL